VIQQLNADKALDAMRATHRSFSEQDADMFWMGAFGKNRYVSACDAACNCLKAIKGWEAFTSHIQSLMADHPDMGSAILARFFEELGLDPERATWADMERALEATA
jgi:hypothetical protein